MELTHEDQHDRKRPRLSIFRNLTPANDLDVVRHENDMALKGRFESIFAKYSRDFTGIGDEIDVMSGDIVVNNGHLESMETETDLGINGFSSVSKSILRAMAVTLNPDLPGPDDVLASIESIAECIEDLSSDDGTSSAATHEDGPMILAAATLEPYDSDMDSLFDQRHGSADSLFDEDRATSQTLYADSDDQDIIARFGPAVGKEVLNLIEQRQDAHIEPAWRIPVNLRPRVVTGPIVGQTSSPTPEILPSDRQIRSLWKAPCVNSNSKHRTREESADPLQEDFEADPEPFPGAESGSAYEELNEETEIVQSSRSGICPYCMSSFGNKSGVMSHWDRWLRRPQHKSSEPDPHDLELMKKVRSRAVARIRQPRLVVYDFRTMVELHEVAGLSFEEIAASKILRTRKTGLQLQTAYNKHRSGLNALSGQWTVAELEILERMCQNSLVTMASLHRALRPRTEQEIGDRLAATWIAQFKDKPNSMQSKVEDLRNMVKHESDDELFN